MLAKVGYYQDLSLFTIIFQQHYVQKTTTSNRLSTLLTLFHPQDHTKHIPASS